MIYAVFHILLYAANKDSLQILNKKRYESEPIVQKPAIILQQKQ